jgi:hypothetical protein
LKDEQGGGRWMRCKEKVLKENNAKKEEEKEKEKKRKKGIRERD